MERGLAQQGEPILKDAPQKIWLPPQLSQNQGTKFAGHKNDTVSFLRGYIHLEWNERPDAKPDPFPVNPASLSGSCRDKRDTNLLQQL